MGHSRDTPPTAGHPHKLFVLAFVDYWGLGFRFRARVVHMTGSRWKNRSLIQIPQQAGGKHSDINLLQILRISPVAPFNSFNPPITTANWPETTTKSHLAVLFGFGFRV